MAPERAPRKDNKHARTTKAASNIDWTSPFFEMAACRCRWPPLETPPFDLQLGRSKPRRETQSVASLYWFLSSVVTCKRKEWLCHWRSAGRGTSTVHSSNLKHLEGKLTLLVIYPVDEDARAEESRCPLGEHPRPTPVFTVDSTMWRLTFRSLADRMDVS